MRGLWVLLVVTVAACSSEAPPSPCEPTGGGPYWVVEGDSLNFGVACATGLTGPGAELAVMSLPAGASYDPITATVSFVPDFDQAAVYRVALVVVATGEIGSVKIGVADAAGDPRNVLIADPLHYTEEFGLPVFFLSPGPSASDVYAPTTVSYGGHAYAAEGKKRGAASLGYPKNSYTLKFDGDDRFQAPAHDFVDKKKLVLISTFDDNSYLRQRLAYELWNRMDPAHLQIQVFSAVVYVEGEYWGLYTVADHVDRHLMEAHGLSPDGNLYKAVNHDANFDTVSRQSGGPKNTLHDGLVKREGLPVDDYADLDELVGFVAQSSDDELRAGLGDRVDLRDYQDWWVLVTFMLADDSAGKNSYHFHDPLGGPWRFLPWDFNHSFGQTWQSDREAADIHQEYRDANRLFDRMLAEPTFADPMLARYAELLSGPLEISALLDIVDEWIVEIDASARRDEQLWGAAYRSYGGWSWRSNFTTYDEELDYLREWLAARWSFQDAIY